MPDAARRWWRGARPGTLRGRLALLALFSTAIWVVLLTVAFNVALAGRLRDQADDLLRTRASAVAATIRVQPDRSLTIDEPADDSALDAGIWVYQRDRALERPAGSAELQQHADRLAGRGPRFENAAAARLYARPVRDHGRQVGTVVTAVGLAPYRHTARSALAGSIGLAILLLGGVYLVTRLVIGRALKPVAAMSRQAARWSGHDIGRRFGPARRPAELDTLAGSLDELLDRIAAVLRHEQQLTGELSHELRTPLARITAETDWLLARPRDAGERRVALKAIAQGTERMRTICETLLSEARARSAEAPGRCDTGALARSLAIRHAQDHPTAPPLTVSLSGAGAELTAGVSPELAERILAPLLDNARRYAVGAIVLECSAAPGTVRVAVRDDGPGVPVGAREAIFEPGYRADPADGHDGAGLGLPLARRLARTAGGELVAAPADRGARFVVTLPAG
ncbi:histidine kinase [Streptomyces albus subsp. albus]|nr:histidine kinase [Streptomyces albus subsp. albus]